MGTEFKQMFNRLRKIKEELEPKMETEVNATPNLPDNENEWEYHEYLKRLEAEDFEEHDLWSEYPF